MPTFSASALDRFIEPDNMSSMELVRTPFDPESQRRPVTANPRNGTSMNGNYSKMEVRGSSLPPNPYLIRGASIPLNRKHERGASLSSAPNLESDGNIPTIPKLDRGTSLHLSAKLGKEIPVPCEANGSSASAGTVVERKDHWTEISPALYATPVSTPLPDSPSQFSPSPYIINHKRRGPRLVKSFSEEDILSCKQSTSGINLRENGDVAAVSNDGCNGTPVRPQDSATASICDDRHGTNDDPGIPEQNGGMNYTEFELAKDSENEDFINPHDLVTARSIAEDEGNCGAERNLNPTTPLSEFYDAWEELSSESGYQLSTPRTENELRGMRMSLLMEIEKRKQAEEVLNSMRCQWRRIRDQLSDVGLRLPEAPSSYPPDEQPADSVPDICHQVLVSYFVSGLIGRGLAKAEVEKEMEAQVSMKNTEIARLCDKLRYYEAVNQEMSQRNQEIVEKSRQLRLRRKRRQKWIWGTFATGVTVVLGSLAYSYFQSGRPSSSGECLPPMAEQKPSQ